MIRHKCPLIKYIVLAKMFGFAHDVSGGEGGTLKELFSQPNNSVLIRTVVFKLLVSELLYILKITEDSKGLCIYGLNLCLLYWESKLEKCLCILHLKTAPRYPLQVTINNRT